jgi:hypothetical protein
MYKILWMGSKVLLAALSVIVLVITISCREEPRSYNELILEVVDSLFFAFEYPSDYDDQSFYVESDIAPVNLNIFLGRSAPEGDHNEILLHIDTIEPWLERPNAKSLLDFDLELDRNSKPEFRLLERSSVMVGTIQAEQAVFSYSLSALGLGFIVERTVYFDYDGLIYNFRVSADQSVAGTANVDFEHLLKTFKFLD